jgi:hypothetical protein
MATASSSTSGTPTLTACRDGCGRSVTDDELPRSGWTFLAIARRWRCPECVRALQRVSEAAPAAAPTSTGA